MRKYEYHFIMLQIKFIPWNSIENLFNNRENKCIIDILSHFAIPLYLVAAISYNNHIFDLRDSIDLLYQEPIYIIYISDPAGLDILRHSMTHLMAQAVQMLYKGTQLGTGPTTEDGFFYDFLLPNNINLNNKSLKKIQEKMMEIIDQNLPIRKKTLQKNQAIELFTKENQPYKVEILNRISDAEVSLYSQGDFIDLCRGPHVYSTGSIGKNFQLINVSGVCWQSNSDYKSEESTIEATANSAIQMQRIHAIGFNTAQQLAEYHQLQSNNKLMDHKKIGVENHLFSFHPTYCSGGVFWEEKGFIIYNNIIQYLRKTIEEHGYFEVKTPIIYNEELWKLSGHWQNYKENMFHILSDHSNSKSMEKDEQSYYLSPKPMNCPAHITLFKSRTRSYRDLPMRMAEFGCCFRNETSGSLDGLMRLREFTQDDAHIFCEFSQVKEETKNFCKLLKKVYKDFGFAEIKIMLSTKPKKSLGSAEQWAHAETALMQALEEEDYSYSINHGDGAFYGPKLEFSLRDRGGRYWQCGTFQLDFMLAQRMNAKFVNSQGEEEYVIICHRAILGSIERFLGVLIENNAGHFPFWLAPIQISILPISQNFNEYGREILLLLNKKYRVHLDDSDNTIGRKIKQGHLEKIPLGIILGAQELNDETVTIRSIRNEKHTIKVDKSTLINHIEQFIKQGI